MPWQFAANFCCSSASDSDMRVRQTIFATLVICAVGLARFGGVIVVSAQPHESGCHDSGPPAPSQPSDDHQCCSIGHDHAMPKQAVNPKISPAVAALVQTAQLAQIESNSAITTHHLLTASAGPPSNTPLRI